MKKLAIGAGVLLLLGAGAAVALPPLLWGDGVDYSQVASIEKAPEYKDAALMKQAWALPVAARYAPEPDYQKNGSFCGPTSVVNVMRSLGQAADQDHVLDETGVSTFLGVLPGGVTLDQLAEIARKKTQKKVTVLRDITVAELREHLKASNDPGKRYIVNFHRGPLFARGGGHHSPIGGYLADKDLALVVDVNKKYQPWLVSTERLHRAIDTVDKQSKQKRGLLLIE